MSLCQLLLSFKCKIWVKMKKSQADGVFKIIIKQLGFYTFSIILFLFWSSVLFKNIKRDDAPGYDHLKAFLNGYGGFCYFFCGDNFEKPVVGFGDVGIKILQYLLPSLSKIYPVRKPSARKPGRGKLNNNN